MHILIGERLKPFSHDLKSLSILPGSSLFAEIYPALILVYSLGKSEAELVSKIETSIIGPVKGFTVQLNLEKGYLLIFGEGKNGYFRYKIKASVDGKELFIGIEKQDKITLTFKQLSGNGNLKLHRTFDADGPLNNERLSLGNHKLQDFALVKRRQDLKEIFPIWIKAAGFYPTTQEVLNEGTCALLKIAEQAIEKKDINHLLEPFLTLFNASFYGMMVPSLNDVANQGLKLPKVLSKISPILLITYGAKLIRSLFIDFKQDVLTILPALPKEFHAGRFLHLALPNAGMLDLEWSKKIVRRMVFFADHSTTLHLKLPKEIKRFRLKQEGLLPEWVNVETPLHFEKGTAYFFDRFEK